MIVVLMGVSGSGKTTVGRSLAAELGWAFLDADDFHSQASIAKMAAGIALTDDDRFPWLDRLAEEIRAETARDRDVVLACSALKQGYRERLAQGAGQDLVFVYLKGDATTIEPRLASRSGHYMPASLLASQFAALEEPAGAIVVDIRQTPKAQAAEIAAQLRSMA
jgi:gluconokinase